MAKRSSLCKTVLYSWVPFPHPLRSSAGKRWQSSGLTWTWWKTETTRRAQQRSGCQVREKGTCRPELTVRKSGCRDSSSPPRDGSSQPPPPKDSSSTLWTPGKFLTLQHFLFGNTVVKSWGYRLQWFPQTSWVTSHQSLFLKIKLPVQFRSYTHNHRKNFSSKSHSESYGQSSSLSIKGIFYTLIILNTWKSKIILVKQSGLLILLCSL